jgi:prepilin peptidase dependent protein B
MLNQNHYQRGFTLVELMVGLVISLIILSFTLTAYLAIDKNNRTSINTMQLDYELRRSLSLMVDDIRRAGYWGLAQSNLGSGVNSNPFMAADTDIQIPSSSCILMTYDFNSDGTLPTLNTAGGDKRFGYRLSNGVLQTRIVPSATFNCASADWADMIDSKNIRISALSFSFSPNPPVSVNVFGTGTGTATITVRNVAISITGTLTSDPTVSRTLTETVRVRNDKFVA